MLSRSDGDVVIGTSTRLPRVAQEDGGGTTLTLTSVSSRGLPSFQRLDLLISKLRLLRGPLLAYFRRPGGVHHHP